MRAWSIARRSARPALAGGLAIVAILFAGAVAYLPHMVTSEDDATHHAWVRLADAYVDLAKGDREDYPYTLHVDEHVHWVRMSAIQRADSLAHPNPYTGQGVTTSGGQLGLNGIHESGFHVAGAQFQEMTGIPWIQVIRFGPMVASMLAASLMWVALRPWPGAPLAAALTALAPTSARFLGPGFLVPSGAGLVWIAATLALSKWLGRDKHVFALALLVTGWAFFIHLIDGAAAVLVLLISIPLAVRGNRKALAGTIAGTVLPLAWFYGRFREEFQAEAEVFTTIPANYAVFDQIGVPIIFAWALGMAMLLVRPPRHAARVPLVAGGITSAIVFALMLANRRFDWNLYALYDRWHQPLAFFLAIGAAVAVVEGVRWAGIGARRLASFAERPHGPDRLQRALAHPAVAALLALPLMTAGGAAIASDGLDAHLQERYYHVLNDQDWARFHAASTIGPHHEVFLVHPWKAPVYTAMTGKQPLTWLDPGSPPKHESIYREFYRGGHQDPVWLVRQDISLVLEGPDIPTPFEAHESGAYVLDSGYARQLYEVRHPGIG